MDPFAKEWGDVYNKSILAFTGRNKVAVRELEPVVKGTAGLVKSLTIIDANDPAAFSAKQKAEKKKAIVGRAKEYKNLKKESAKYTAILDTAIKATDKQLHEEAYRELKVLKTHLDWVVKAVENAIVTGSKEAQELNDNIAKAIQKKGAEIRKEGAKEGKTDTEQDKDVREGTQFLKFAKLLVAFPTAAKTGAARALKAIKAVKADPTVATYNTEIDHGGRNYTQQMNNAIALARDPNCPEDLKQLLAGLIPYDGPLKEYGGGDRRPVDAGTAPNVILRLIDQYSTLVKDTIGYIDVVTKYVAKNKKKLGMK